MYRSNGGASIASNGWANSDPYFTWTAGADNAGGSGILGYCLYLGQDPSGNPITTKGYLGASPVNTNGACQFAISSANIDTSLSGYIGTALTSSASPYYLNIKAIDNATMSIPVALPSSSSSMTMYRLLTQLHQCSF